MSADWQSPQLERVMAEERHRLMTEATSAITRAGVLDLLLSAMACNDVDLFQRVRFMCEAEKTQWKAGQMTEHQKQQLGLLVDSIVAEGVEQVAYMIDSIYGSTNANPNDTGGPAVSVPAGNR